MHVLITTKTVFQPAAWTLGLCPSCLGPEVVRVEDAVEVTSVYFVPFSRRVVGQEARCDFCERPLTRVLSAKRAGLDAWSPADGAAALARLVGVDPGVLAGPRDGDGRLRSLLGSVADATTFRRLDAGLGLAAGLILGGPLGAAFGYYVLPSWDLGTDGFGCVFGGILGGLVLGAVAGAGGAAAVRRRTEPFRRLRRAFARGGLNVDRLETLADESAPSRVRNAVRRLRDELMFAPSGVHH